MLHSRMLAAVLGLVAALPTLADAPEDRLDQLLSLNLEQLYEMEVRISTETSQRLATAPAVVTVITAEDIKATGAVNLAEVLEGVPGVNIRANQFGNRPLVHFRGANATQTLLMVNGAPMKDLMWGFGIFWKGLPTSMIDRVEIIRGPGSALFGADASTGVINVITKTAVGIEGSGIGARAGSFGTRSVDVQYGGAWNGFDAAFTAVLQDTDGHDPFIGADAQTRSDLQDGTDVSLAPGSAAYGWRNLDLRFSLARTHWRLLADYMRHDDVEIGLTGAGVLDPVTEAEDSRFDLALLYDNGTLGKNWGLQGELRYRDLSYSSGDGFQERPSGYAGVYADGIINRMRSSERQISGEISASYRGIDNHDLLFGAGYSWQDLYEVEQFTNSGVGPDGGILAPGSPLVNLSGSPYAFAPEKARTVFHLFLQDIWTLSERWELTAGARYDHYSDFGGTLNPRFALVWQTSARLTSKLMYGRAFRAPSYQELYAETSFTLPNPQLDPERSRTWDLSFDYKANRDLYLSLNLFHFDQTDLIRATPVAGQEKRQFRNTGSHVIRGVEMEFKWQAAPDLRLSANLSLRSQDDNAYRALGVAERDAYLRADWSFRPRWNWNLQANWIGEASRRAGDNRPPVEDYWLADTTVRYTGSADWEFAGSVRNLFDADARAYTGAAIPDDLPLPGRSFYLEARYKL